MDLFTSDLHFNHKNIISYTDRPWATTQDMDRALIENFNARVGPNDTCYILGDFAFGPKPTIANYLSRLQGNIILIRGNHDKGEHALHDCGFKTVHDKLDISQCVGERTYAIRLQHKPPHPEDQILIDPSIDYILCGHVHTSWDRKDRVINVGVDISPNYCPLTFEELLNRVAIRPFKSHHEEY